MVMVPANVPNAEELAKSLVKNVMVQDYAPIVPEEGL